MGFNGIRTHGLCVSAAVLYQLSYEDPYIGSRPIYWVHLNPWQEYRMKMMWTAEIQMKWRFDHRSYNSNLSNCKFKPEKNFWASTGFEPMASALALQCSTNWAMKTHILGAGQFIEFISTRDRNIEWRWCELRKYKWNEDLTIAVIILLYYYNIINIIIIILFLLHKSAILFIAVPRYIRN